MYTDTNRNGIRPVTSTEKSESGRYHVQLSRRIMESGRVLVQIYEKKKWICGCEQTTSTFIHRGANERKMKVLLQVDSNISHSQSQIFTTLTLSVFSWLHLVTAAQEFLPHETPHVCDQFTWGKVSCFISYLLQTSQHENKQSCHVG